MKTLHSRLILAVALLWSAPLLQAQCVIDEWRSDDFLGSRGASTAQHPIATEGDLTVLGNPMPRLSSPGFVEVLRRVGDDWTLEETLLHPTGDPSVSFGETVAVDEGRIYVSLGPDGAAGSNGAILMYERASTWVESGRIEAPSIFTSVASWGEKLAVDGDLMAVSFYQFSQADVLLFEFDGASWNYRWQYVDVLSSSFLAGTPGLLPTVAVSGDNVIIGTAAGYLPAAGRVWTVRRSGGQFEREYFFSHPQPTFLDGFGGAVAVNGDTALIGAPGAGVSGQVLVFERQASGHWEHKGTLSDPGATVGAGLGARVSFDGSRAVAGAPLDARVASSAGSAALFADDGAGFAQVGSLLPTWALGGERYGDGVDLSGDDVVVFSNNENSGGSGDEVRNADRLVLYSFGGSGCPELVGVPAEIPALTGAVQELLVDAGPSHAGEAYVVLGSLSGTQPGFSIQGFTIPLNVDPYFLATLTQPNLPPLASSFGTLDSLGQAAARFEVPPVPGLLGTIGDHAAVVLELPTRTITLVTRPQRLALL